MMVPVFKVTCGASCLVRRCQWLYFSMREHQRYRDAGR
jgi:hypothetical protein